MTIDDLLDIAIQHEIASQQLYAEMHERADDPETRAFLKQLVDEETRHEALLRTMKDMEIYDGDIAVTDETLIRGVGASHSTAVVPPPEHIEAVLELSLTRETRARNLFLALAASTEHPELRLMFENLAAEELNHHHSIEKKYAMQKGEMGFEM